MRNRQYRRTAIARALPAFASGPVSLRRISLPAIMAACWVLSCRQDRTRPAAPQTAADSANVAIIVLRGGDRARLADTASRSLDVADARVVLHGVIGGVRLSDGRYAVGSRYTHQIVLFDSAKHETVSFGRSGSGPGEFRDLMSVVVAGDETVAALDARLRRITLVRNGSLVRDFVVTPPALAAPMGQAALVGSLGNGRLLMWLQTMPSQAELDALNRPNSVGQIPLVLFSVDSLGHAAEPLGVFPGEEQYMGTLPGSAQPASFGRAPFGRWTRFGTHGDRVYVFRNAEQDIRVYSSAGLLLSMYRTDWPEREVSRDDRQRIIEERVGGAPAGASVEEWRRQFEAMHFPPVMPAYRDALIGSDGIIWIEPYRDWNGEHRVYIAYDSTGTALGRLALGYRDRILQIGHGRALLLRVNEDNTETLRLKSFRF
jgi:hypothetical protein